MRRLKNWICDWNAVPDFKQIVEKSLALFGVFTGVTLSFYIKDFLFAVPDGFKEFPLWSRELIAAAAITLLLRYIVGSAVHLNSTYVPKVTTTIKPNPDGSFGLVEVKEVKSASLGWLFFDVLVLVLFGVFAVFIIYSINFNEFMYRSLLFILLGFLWSLIAVGLRPKDRAIAIRWLLIDGAQAAITFGLMKAQCDNLTKTIILALLYVFCLFLDFCVVSRPPPPEPAVPVKDDVKAVLDRVLTWPSERQEDAAKLLLLLQSRGESVSRLTDEQLEEVRRRIADPNRKLIHGEPAEAR